MEISHNYRLEKTFGTKSGYCWWWLIFNTACYLDPGLIIWEIIVEIVDKQKAFHFMKLQIMNIFMQKKSDLQILWGEKDKDGRQDMNYAIKLYLECVESSYSIATSNHTQLISCMVVRWEFFKYYRIAQELSGLL
jgi:hypothetical protein